MLYRVHDEDKINHARALCRMASGVPDLHYIPFEAPTSIDADTMHNPLHTVVSLKADGIRYMLVLCMYMNKPHAFLVNRAEEVYVVLIAAPQQWFHHTHVYEVELCTYKPEPYKKILLVFNVLYCHEPMHQTSYRQRYDLVQQHTCPTLLDSLADRHIASRTIMTSMHPGLYIVTKPCHPVQALATLSPSPWYDCDGYIFTSLVGGMTTGRNSTLLKWKNKHTVDLRLVVTHNDVQLLTLHRGRYSRVTHCTCRMTPLLSSILRGHALYTKQTTFDEIVEFEIQGKELVYNCIRRDKTTPNDTLTVSRTFAAVEDGVSLETLISVYTIKKSEV